MNRRAFLGAAAALASLPLGTEAGRGEVDDSDTDSAATNQLSVVQLEEIPTIDATGHRVGPVPADWGYKDEPQAEAEVRTYYTTEAEIELMMSHRFSGRDDRVALFSHFEPEAAAQLGGHLAYAALDAPALAAGDDELTPPKDREPVDIARDLVTALEGDHQGAAAAYVSWLVELVAFGE